MMKSFDFHFNLVENAHDSILAAIASFKREPGRKWALGEVRIMKMILK